MQEWSQEFPKEGGCVPPPAQSLEVLPLMFVANNKIDQILLHLEENINVRNSHEGILAFSRNFLARVFAI